MASLDSDTSADGSMNMFNDVTPSTILCCTCGLPIVANPANSCLSCLKNRVDLTASVPKQNNLQWCRFCTRYFQPPSAWLSAELESRQLLALCLKRIKGYGGRDEPSLVDAGFYWTEPHSRRIRVWLSLQGEVSGCQLQQKCCVEFQVLHLMCSECQRAETKHDWRGTLQLRQRAAHKKTLLFLEQLLLRLQPHKHVTQVKQTPDGLDFFFLQQDQARKLVDFFLEAVPCKYKASKELISHDTHNNTYDYKIAYSVEVVPVCKGDVVFLPKPLARSLGCISQGPLVCFKVAQLLHLIDPLTLQTCEVSGTQYWRHPFPVLSHPRNLMQFLVLENEVDAKFKKGIVRHSKGFGAPSNSVLSDLWLLRMHQGSALESDQDQIHTRTHLGHLLKPGDLAIGFALSTSNLNLSPDLQRDLDSQSDRIPDVILLKKFYGDSGKRARRRNWELKRLGEMEVEREGLAEFMEELEEDTEMRKHVNIYKKPYAKRHQKKRKRAPAGMEVDGAEGREETMETGGSDESSDEGDMPVIELEEMLEDLSLDPADK